MFKVLFLHLLYVKYILALYHDVLGTVSGAVRGYRRERLTRLEDWDMCYG